MEFYLAKKNGHYIPAFTEDYDASCKVKEGDIVQVKVVDARNVLLHKKLMKLFDIGFENQDKYRDKKKYRDRVLIRIGWCTMYMDENAQCFFTPKSLKFEDLPNEEEFKSEVYNPCVEEIARQLRTKDEVLAIEVLNNF